MILFPELGQTNLTPEDNEIREYMYAFYSTSMSPVQVAWAEMDMDARFEAGDASVFSQLYGPTPNITRKNFSFNRIRRTVNMISGRQRQNRKSLIVVPRESSSEETANQFTKVMLYTLDKGNMLNTFSEAFHQGTCITGISLLQLWLDFRDDPVSGDLRMAHRSYNSVVMDPFFRNRDLSDCNGIWTRQYVTNRDAMGLLPDHAEEINKLPTIRNGSYDGKFQYMPENYNTHKFALVTYDEFYYKDYRMQTMLIDVESGECLEWSGTKEQLDQFLNLYPQITSIEKEVQTVNQAILVQGKVFYRGRNTLGIDTYPFVPLMGYFNPDVPYYSQRIQSVTRGLRDAQYLYNRRRCIELDILESQVNSGWLYKESALVNPSDVFLYGQGRGVALKKDAEMTDVQKIVAPEVPQSMIQLSELLAKEVSEISGVSEELLGSASDDVAGILSALRQGAGLTTLQILFDNADLALKLIGEKILAAVQKNYTPGKIEQIIQEKPSQEFYTKNFGKYDAVVEEGLNTETQKQMQYAQYVQMMGMGLPIPFEQMVNASTIQNKKELIEAMNAAKEKQEGIAQLQQQMAMAEMQANVRLADATAQSQQGSAAERYSRVDENKALAVEKIALAQKDRDMALLDVIKSLKELEGMDIDRLHSLLDIANKIKDHQGLTPVADMEMSAAPQAMPPQQPMMQPNAQAPGAAFPGPGLEAVGLK